MYSENDFFVASFKVFEKYTIGIGLFQGHRDSKQDAESELLTKQLLSIASVIAENMTTKLTRIPAVLSDLTAPIAVKK